MGPEDERLLDVGGLRRARHEASVAETFGLGPLYGLVHRVDDLRAGNDDEQGRRSEVERLVADILRDPYGAVLRNAERAGHHPQIDIDQFARVLHPVGVDRRHADPGEGRGDRPGFGVAAAHGLVERFARPQLHGAASGGCQPLGERGCRIVETLRCDARFRVGVFGHAVCGKPFQNQFLAIHRLSFLRLECNPPVSIGH